MKQMTIWVTSDLHFGHANILKYNSATRQYQDADHMNEELIRQWNEQVQDDDMVYILGDVAFCPAERAVALIKRLKGNKILIEGNHDKKLVTNQEFCALFDEIHSYHEIHYKRNKICMFHYPIAEWNQGHYGSMMLHGHAHGNYKDGQGRRIMDVGVDATGQVVTRLDDVVETLSRRVFISHHGQTTDNNYA